MLRYLEERINREILSLSLSLGRRVDIEQAIDLIAKRFPPARYPQVVFKPINKKIVLRQRPPERVSIPQSAAQVMFSSKRQDSLINDYRLALSSRWYTNRRNSDKCCLV